MNQILLFKDENIFYCAHALRVGFFGGVFTPPSPNHPLRSFRHTSEPILAAAVLRVGFSHLPSLAVIRQIQSCEDICTER